MDLVEWARWLAERQLAEALPRRWAHSQGVARRAESIAHVLGDAGELLVAAAVLHDVGYTPPVVATGLHSLDGARFLRDGGVAGDVLCRLVAHHSCARIEAARRGLAGVLLEEFPLPEGLLLDSLTFCDMTTSPDGSPVRVDDRLAEILARYGPGHLVTESITEAQPEILRAVRRIQGLAATASV